MEFKTWFEGIAGYNELHKEMVSAFMESKGKDTFHLLAYADLLEEKGNPLGRAIRMALKPGKRTNEYHNEYSEIIKALHKYEPPFHKRSHDKVHPEFSTIYYCANFNLNADISPLSRNSRERNRYYHIDVPAGGWIYKFEPTKFVIQSYISPNRMPKGEVRKNKFSINGDAYGEKEFGPEHFVNIPFSQLPEQPAIYFFLIALSSLYWSNATYD